MSVLLIEPMRSCMKKGNIWKAIKRDMPTLGLAYIASYLEKQGTKVKIIDMQTEMLNISDIILILKEFKFDFVGITATTVQINSALQLAKSIKGFDKNIKIVMGGPHPHIFAEDLLRYEFIDYIIRGEGEYAFWELISGEKLSSILGLSYKLNGEIILNPVRPPLANLDILPFPARHLLPMDKYHPSGARYLRLPVTSMITSRGCPGKCTFCYTDTLGRITRFRSAQNIFEEVNLLIDQYKIKEIMFYDDTFTARRNTVAELCKMIVNQNLDLTWSCLSRVDCVDEDLLKLMKYAGCHTIGYGVESADEVIIKNINKKISLEKVKETVALTKKVGIKAYISFMIGNPGETEEAAKKTINFALALKPDIFVYNITTPYPGTAMFNWAKENGYLTTYNWDDYDAGHIVMQLPTISPDLIRHYYRYAYRRFYCRPSYILQHLKKINSWEILKTNVDVFLKMLSNVILKW